MIRKLVLATATAAGLVAGLTAMTSSTEAHMWHRHWHGHHGFGGPRFGGPGFGLFLGVPFGGGYGYSDPYYDDPVYYRPYCHPQRIWFHHHWHRARVCGGHITRIW